MYGSGLFRILPGHSSDHREKYVVRWVKNIKFQNIELSLNLLRYKKVRIRIGLRIFRITYPNPGGKLLKVTDPTGPELSGTRNRSNEN
jgi:hypothetical protein